jgi:hypothetical protein
LSLSGLAQDVDGPGGRGRLARDAAEDTLRVCARAGLGLYHGPEGVERLLDGVGDGRLVVHFHCDALGPDKMEGRLSLARERLRKSCALDVLIEGARLLAPDGDALWCAAGRLQAWGAEPGAVGIAVEPGGDALGLARRFKPRLMQMSAGLLDQRLIASGALAEIAGLGIEIHLRIQLLRGLLFLPRDGLPPAMAGAGPQVSRVRRLIAEAGADPLQAALAFALDRPEATRVIVEASSSGEVRAALAAAAQPSPSLDWAALAVDNPTALDAEARMGRRAA